MSFVEFSGFSDWRPNPKNGIWQQIQSQQYMYKCIFFTTLLLPGRYLLPLTTVNRYLSRSSDRKFLFATPPENVSTDRHKVIPHNCPTFELCQDSVNSVNSSKVIRGNTSINHHRDVDHVPQKAWNQNRTLWQCMMKCFYRNISNF